MVKCATCGLLTGRKHENREFIEVHDEARVDPGHGITTVKGEAVFPLCFVQAFNLQEESKTAAAHDVIHHERNCVSHVDWQQGFTPKEHLEMLQAEDLRKWHEERRREDLEWRAKQEREQDAARKQDLVWLASESEKAESRWQREHKLQRHQLLWVGVIGTSIIAIAQIVSAIIPFLLTKK